MTSIKTLIVDKQLMFVEGLRLLLEKVKSPSIKIVDVVTTTSEIEDVLSKQDIDLVLIDLNLPDEDGLQIIPALRESYSDLRICVLTSYRDSKFVKASFQHGADGYLVKSNSIVELLNGVVEIMKGNTFLGEGLRITPSRRRVQAGHSTDKMRSNYEDRFVIRQKLTRREQEILQLITQAKNNKEIAEELYISDQTVGVHRKNIMRKLGVRNTVNLIKFAMEYQLV